MKKIFIILISTLFLLASCDEYSKEKNEVINFITSQLNDPDSFRLDEIIVEDISYRHVMYHRQSGFMASSDKAMNEKGRGLWRQLETDTTDIKKYAKTITIYYGAKNGFGGMVIDSKKFLLKSDGTIDGIIVDDFKRLDELFE